MVGGGKNLGGTKGTGEKDQGGRNGGWAQHQKLYFAAENANYAGSKNEDGRRIQEERVGEYVRWDEMESPTSSTRPEGKRKYSGWAKPE